MSKKKPKRDGSIAMASLLIYPPFDAFEEFIYGRNTHVGHYYEKTWRISDAIDVGVREVFSGDSYVFWAKFKPAFNFRIGSEWERRAQSDSTRISWMNNFALVCLDVAYAKNWYNRMFNLKKLLTEKQLPRRMCWSKAVTDMIAVNRTKSEVNNWRIAPSGLIDAQCPFGRCEIRHLSDDLLASVTRLAKTFQPTSEPVSLGTKPSGGFQQMHADSEGMSFCLSEYSLEVGNDE